MVVELMLILHYAIREGETTQYYDVMNLYPYVCKYCKFPVGQPKIDMGDACLDKQAMMSEDALIKCSALPHKRLYNPVRPFRCNKRFSVYAVRAQSNANF